MPGDKKTNKRRHRLGISKGVPVRIDAPAWVRLNADGNTLVVDYDIPVDNSHKPPLESTTDPAPHTDSAPGE
jgi:hypothetical protein